MLGMTRYKAVILILSLNPGRNYTVVDRAYGREELVLDSDRRESDCTEKTGFLGTCFLHRLVGQTIRR